jgi:hypothetical protein
MTISTECRKCGKSYNVPDTAAGRKIRCKKCQATVVIPDRDADDEEYDDYDDDDQGYDDDYDERPRRRPPQRSRSSSPHRRKKRSSGNGSKVALWITLGVGGTGVIVGLVFLVINLSASRHEKFLKQGIAATNQLASIIESVETADDAKTAAVEVSALMREMKAASTKYMAGERITPEESRELQTKYTAERLAATKRLQEATRKLPISARAAMGSALMGFRFGMP